MICNGHNTFLVNAVKFPRKFTIFLPKIPFKSMKWTRNLLANCVQCWIHVARLWSLGYEKRSRYRVDHKRHKQLNYIYDQMRMNNSGMNCLRDLQLRGTYRRFSPKENHPISMNSFCKQAIDSADFSTHKIWDHADHWVKILGKSREVIEILWVPWMKKKGSLRWESLVVRTGTRHF